MKLFGKKKIQHQFQKTMCPRKRKTHTKLHFHHLCQLNYLACAKPHRWLLLS